MSISRDLAKVALERTQEATQATVLKAKCNAQNRLCPPFFF